MAHTQRADDLYVRAKEDPKFLHAVRDAYTGRHDVLDALWWTAHPTDAAPSGTPSPAVTLGDLKHRLFSADGGLLGDRAATQEMRDLEAQIDADHQDIQRAIEVATRQTPAPPAAEPLGERLPASTSHTTGRIRIVLVLSGIAAALISGLAIGMQAPGGTNSDAPLAALRVFEREQTPEDIPVQRMPRTMLSETFRELLPARYSWTRHSVYAARDRRDMVCLIAVTSDDAHVSTCAREDQFPVQGLQLSWSGALETEEIDGSISVVPAQLHVIWMPDGSIVSTGSSA